MISCEVTKCILQSNPISSLSNTLKRKPLFSSSAGILCQHDIVLLADVTPPENQKRIFLTEVRFGLADVNPPPPKIRKEFS